MTPFDAPLATEAQGLPVDDLGGETSDAELMGAAFDREAIERNYWGMRQQRIADYSDEMRGDISEAIYGDRDAWVTASPLHQGENGPDAPPLGGHVRRMMSDPEGAAAALFGDLEQARQFDPGKMANFPTSFEEMQEMAEERVQRELNEELSEAELAILNRSNPTLKGGVAEFLGSGGAAASDIEGLAMLPWGLGTVNLGRAVLVEGALGAAGEALTAPAYLDQADYLGRNAPNIPLQILAGATFGAILPVALRGGSTALSGAKSAAIRNRDLLPFARRDGASDVERGAGASIARDEASQDMTPAGRDLDEHQADLDQAEAAIVKGEPVIVRPSDILPKAAISGGTPGRVRQILDFIGGAEAPGGYDVVNHQIRARPPRPITQMTVAEVMEWQRVVDPLQDSGEAVGKYQFIRETLARLVREEGLSGNELFDASLQDRLAIRLLEEAGLSDFQAGRISADVFGNRLAGTWAGLPQLSGSGAGKSAHHGVGTNRATVTGADFMAVLTRGGPWRDLSDVHTAQDIYQFNPADLQTDASAYQYKAGGDQNGVTDRLLGEREWDPSAAVGVIVHERADGERFIADGHQRLGLANRFLAEGRTDINLQGYLYREADGWTAPEVRTFAALRNIRQETGTPADAAKIIRDHPELTGMLNRHRSFLRTADGLARLKPGPFEAVINEVIPENQGSIVGRIMPDDHDMQATAIATLAKVRPQNLTEAESVVRDIRRLGLEQRAEDAQASLFGEDFNLRDTVISERARVLSTIERELRTDRTVFNRLAQEGKRIEDAGNVLDQTANLSRTELAQRALERLILLADEDGPIRDAIDIAAKAIREGRPIQDAARDVIELLRSADPKDGTGNAAARNADAGIESPRLIEGEQAVSDAFDAAIAAQPFSDVDELVSLAVEVQVRLVDRGRGIGAELGIEFVPAKVKARETLVEKIGRKGYSSPREITDAARAGFKVETTDQAAQLVDALTAHYDVIDEGWKRQPSGYVDRKLLVIDESGMIAEVQIWSRAMFDAKKAQGQSLYTRTRSLAAKTEKTPQDLALLKKLRAEQIELYSAANFEADASFSSAGTSSSPNFRSKRARHVSSGSTDAELNTSQWSTSSQSPSGRNLASANSSVSNPGRRSQSTNVSDISEAPSDPLNLTIRSQQFNHDLPDVGSTQREPDLFGDPVDGRGAQAQADRSEIDLREALAANRITNDKMPDLLNADGDSVNMAPSTLLADIEAERNFLDDLKICFPKGGSNG